ncbi:MAG: DUF3386 domain-containing protein [Cyanobacteria bacterium]|nr:DUF3386 domain-containing protein [Cyanobacteriota bacterium]MDA0867096.1 DUF3386 domain-containing protein [Cyanobacteriota bacterium]
MVTTQVSARDRFRTAYENRYTWDANFPGYTADITYLQGEKTITGQGRVGADLKAEVTGIEDEAAQKAIHGQLWEVAIHRVRRGFEDTHGNNTFTYGKTLEDGSVEILMGGKAEGDRYHLKNNEVSMVHRQIHGTVVTIHTFSSHETGAGYLSHRYDSVYHDPKTGEQKGGRSTFEDTYTQVGDYVILSERKIETELGDRTESQTFRFDNIQLLSA